MIEGASETTLQSIKDLSAAEMTEIDLLLAVFKAKVKGLVDSKIEEFEKDFDKQCAYYKKSVDSVAQIKEELTNSYVREYGKILDRYEEQFINLIFELQDAQSNQKISIVNYKKTIEKKERILNSAEYDIYIKSYNALVEKINQANSEDEIDGYEIKISALVDPMEPVNKTIDSLVEKYGNYCGLEEEILTRLDECQAAAIQDLEAVMKIGVGELAVQDSKSIVEVIKKVFSKLFGGKGFEKSYVESNRSNIAKLKIEADGKAEKIDENTVGYVSLIMSYKEQIKEKYESAVAV